MTHFVVNIGRTSALLICLFIICSALESLFIIPDLVKCELAGLDNLPLSWFDVGSNVIDIVKLAAQ